jgi:hypothetical protein
MSSNKGSHTERSQTAEQALDAIPHGGRDAIYASPLRARSHGSHDLPDSPHSGHEATRWLDLLHPDPVAGDDALPAWCDCGQRTLSRADLLKWIEDGDHRVVVD